MMISKTGMSLAALAILMVAGTSTYARATCQDVVPPFERAVAARSVEAARLAVADIADDVACRTRIDEFRGRLVDFLVTYAATPGAVADRGRAVEVAERTLEIIRNWQLAEKLADHFMSRGDRVNAHHWYEQSVSFLATPGNTATPVERHVLLTRLAAAKSLANDDQEGRKATNYVPSMRELDGGAGGVFSKVFRPRGVEVVDVPVPINFYTNETRFTPLGEKALQELAKAVRDEGVRTMKLVGHADPRGGAQYNMDLSRRRVEAVRSALQREGVASQIIIDWKGAQQPFDIDVLPYRPSQEEIWQLDRRVEWVREAKSE